MAVNQSYVGSITNPIVEARLAMNFSSSALAKRLGLSKQYISRAEQGTYSSLNPALIRWVSNAMNWSPESAVRRYVQFQHAQRRATVENVNPHKLERLNPTETENEIFERWRSGYWPSPMAFATGFCVHPDLVTKYEEGISKGMPRQIREILSQHNLIGDNL